MTPRIAICLATYSPDLELFRQQVDSIRAQTGVEWHCFVSDDHSPPEDLAGIEQVIGDDSRFTLSASGENIGFYRNFERAIGMVPEEYELVALSDQDDRWYDDKLSSLAGALGKAQLVYSDQRLVTEDGQVIADTYWTSRQNNYTDLISLLVANTVTGAASLFRRSVVEKALPFPELPGEQYHDHWLAMVAISLGDIAYVDRPLYDYVQHGGAVLGHEKANQGFQSAGWRRIDPRGWRGIVEGWGSAYFDVYLRLKAIAQTLLERCGAVMEPGKKRELERFARSDRSLTGPFWMGLRPLRKFTGHRETMGAERIVSRAIAYRHLAGVKRRLPRSMVEKLSRDPDNEIDGLTAQMRMKVAPLFPVVSDSQPRRINVLVPTVDLEHFFGGYIAKFNLARRLAEAGHRTRIVAVDPTPPLPADWKQQVESFQQLGGLFDEIEVSFARDGKEPFRITPDDAFIATTWWTAHIANRLTAQNGRRRFVCLIQEYEPLTVPPGAWTRFAEESYDFPHHALFSTEILRGYFAHEKIGVFAGERDEDAPAALAFRNAITDLSPPSSDELTARQERSLVFYGRPEAHAERNLFEVGVEALRQAVAAGTFGPEWKFSGIGATGSSREIDLGDGRTLELLPRTGQEDYGRFLAGHDLGLALMNAPHPSLVPIEMAAAGMPVVTTTYGETKTAAGMSEISSNLVTVPAEPADIAAGLARAAGMSGDVGQRLAGAEVDWPTDWDQAFSDELIAQVAELAFRRP